MLSAERCVRVTATGAVGAAPVGMGLGVKGFVVQPGATATCVIRQGGAAGTIIFNLAFTASGPAVAFPIAFVAEDLHVTLGAGTEITFIL